MKKLNDEKGLLYYLTYPFFYSIGAAAYGIERIIDLFNVKKQIEKAEARKARKEQEDEFSKLDKVHIQEVENK